jgi:polyisoprenoid-binding protein YceI
LFPLVLALAVAADAPAAAPLVTYRLEPDSSVVRAHTGSSGLFGFAGHEHTVAVLGLRGEVAVDPADPARFALSIEAPADSLRIIDEDRDRDSSLKIERDMKRKVLETEEFPAIAIRGVSFRVDEQQGSNAFRGELEIELTLHGVTRALGVPLELTLAGERLRARGRFALKHSDFKMNRIKVAGLVNVAEKIAIEFDVAGRAAAAGAAP